MNHILTERSVQGNKVSLIPDDSEIKVVRIDTSLRQRRESRSSAKSPKPDTNILTDGDKKAASFEDSRITMLLFEKYKTVELARFFTIAATITIIVFEYEYSYNTQLTGELDNEMEQFLYLIGFFTVISIILTFISYQILMAYQKEAQIITPRANITETPLVWGIIWELILLILIPTPYTRHQKVEFQQRYSDTIRFYFVNEILTFFAMFKGFLLLNIVFKFQKYSSASVGRICRLYSADFNTHLMLKLCIRDRPFETQSALFCVGMFVFAYSLEVAERALFRLDDQVDRSYIGNRCWINMITIFTVGYGDFYPYTDLGRVAMACSVVYGVVVTSLFTATLYNLLTPLQGESLAWAVIDKASVRKAIQNVGGTILFQLNDLQKKKRHFSTIEETFAIKDKVQTLNSLLSQVTQLKRQYRGIDGEEFMAMVKRKFKDLNGQFEDVQEFLEKIQKQQKAIMHNFEKQFDFSIKQSIKVVKEESKDDAFFENLNETLNCSHLMRFEEE